MEARMARVGGEEMTLARASVGDSGSVEEEARLSRNYGDRDMLENPYGVPLPP